jgi:predicted phage baseplate assembly protein
MPLPTPNLDDRRFQDLVDEAKRAIPRYCPEWTDHNVSDPGVTLIELFAWMVESMLYRLNRVPEKSYVTFLELMGVTLEPPAAARAPLTFWLAAPPSQPVAIPAGTEVATVQTAAEDAVIFSTDAEILVTPPRLVACLTSPDERQFADQGWEQERRGQPFLAFQAQPRPGDAFYLGFADSHSGNVLGMTIDCRIEGIGVDPKNPPLAWEAWCNEGWTRAELESDTTLGLNQQGRSVLHLPPRMARHSFGNVEGYWLRCVFTPPEPGQAAYSASPKITALAVEALGGTGIATHATSVRQELLGRSDGTPGQRFRLEYAPVLPLRGGENVEVQREGGEWEAWSATPSFGSATPTATVFCIDYVGGEIAFGPSIREPDGAERQYGAIPPRGASLRMSCYRSGGGARGNVGAGKLTVLKSAVPYVDRVSNLLPAVGGRDAESLERAKLRAPQMLHTSFRAVTAEDYEYLAISAAAGVARACCVQPRALGHEGAPAAGAVKVLLVPSLDQPARWIASKELIPRREMLEEVQQYLDDRRLLTSVLVVGQPEYRWVTVQARLRARPQVGHESLREEAAARLYRFLNPLVGGPAATGWPFGRDLYISEVYAILQGTPGVEFIERVELRVDGDPTPRERITVPADALIASDRHQIVII